MLEVFELEGELFSQNCHAYVLCDAEKQLVMPPGSFGEDDTKPDVIELTIRYYEAAIIKMKRQADGIL